jgi:glycosyltransferase involved in cell wall biosynthesis
MIPKVSVVLCTYNAEKYIRATLESILYQSFKDIEILILDNNSKDTTINIIKTYKDARIYLYPSEKNLGPYGGLNFLLKKAKGEYIAIQDHDDLWHPEKLAKQVAFLEKNKKYI